MWGVDTGEHSSSIPTNNSFLQEWDTGQADGQGAASSPSRCHSQHHEIRQNKVIHSSPLSHSTKTQKGPFKLHTNSANLWLINVKPRLLSNYHARWILTSHIFLNFPSTFFLKINQPLFFFWGGVRFILGMIKKINQPLFSYRDFLEKFSKHPLAILIKTDVLHIIYILVLCAYLCFTYK